MHTTTASPTARLGALATAHRARVRRALTRSIRPGLIKVTITQRSGAVVSCRRCTVAQAIALVDSIPVADRAAVTVR